MSQKKIKIEKGQGQAPLEQPPHPSEQLYTLFKKRLQPKKIEEIFELHFSLQDERVFAAFLNDLTQLLLSDEMALVLARYPLAQKTIHQVQWIEVQLNNALRMSHNRQHASDRSNAPIVIKTGQELKFHSLINRISDAFFRGPIDFSVLVPTDVFVNQPTR